LPGLKIPARGISARAEAQPALKSSPCNFECNR
jgi:hypothetical protein